MILFNSFHSCLPSWSNDEPLTKAYIWYICLAGAFIPSVIMIVANMIVLYILKKVRYIVSNFIIKTGQKFIYPQFLNWFQIINIICFQRHDESQNDDEHQPFWKQYREKQIIVMTLAFLICWAPFAWIYIVKLLGMRDIDSRTIYDMLPLLCVKLGCTVINPIVYVFEKKRVRFKNTQNLSNIFSISTSIKLIYRHDKTFVFSLTNIMGLAQDSWFKMLTKQNQWFKCQMALQQKDEVVFDHPISSSKHKFTESTFQPHLWFTFHNRL